MCETLLSLFSFMCEILPSLRLFFCETLPSVRCVTLPSVRPCLLSYLRPWILRDPWNHVFCEIQPYVKPCPLWDPAFVQYARPSFLSDSVLCDFAIYETQPSVRLCHVWDPAFCEIAFSFIRCRLWVPAFCETLASVTCETLRSVRPCLCSICETCLRDCPCQLTCIYQYHKHITYNCPLFSNFFHGNPRFSMFINARTSPHLPFTSSIFQ